MAVHTFPLLSGTMIREEQSFMIPSRYLKMTLNDVYKDSKSQKSFIFFLRACSHPFELC